MASSYAFATASDAASAASALVSAACAWALAFLLGHGYIHLCKGSLLERLLVTPSCAIPRAAWMDHAAPLPCSYVSLHHCALDSVREPTMYVA